MRGRRGRNRGRGAGAPRFPRRASLRWVRARVLYVPIFAAFEAGQLAETLADWADVESFDTPGCGTRRDEPVAGIEGVAAAAAARLDELGWESCVAVCDSHAQGAGAELARRDPRVKALGIGHAALRYDVGDAGATLSPAVHSAAAQLLDTDYRSFAHAITQMTQGAFGEEWIATYLEQVPQEAAARRLGELPGQELAGRLVGEDLALLLARHVGCVLWFSEGFEAAVAALPGAVAVDCDTVPLADPAFHAALRELCARVLG